MTDDLTLNMDAYLPLRDVVFNTLREAILKGELKPGERLMELQLAAKLGVSRTPIREAIRLAGNSYTWVPWEDNPDYTGMSFVGSIVGTHPYVSVRYFCPRAPQVRSGNLHIPARGYFPDCLLQAGTIPRLPAALKNHTVRIVFAP